MPDSIDMLPTDESTPNHTEIKIIDAIFKQENKSTMTRILESLREIFLAGIVFVIFSLNFVDETIKSFIPSTQNSTMIFLGIKALLFMIVYFFAKNFYLSRK